MVQDHNPNSPHGIKMGESAPNFQLEDVDGNFFSLKEELTERPILINFFRGHY